MDVLETERLIMRPFTPDDHEAAFQALEGHPDVWRYDPGRPRTREERRELINFRIVEYQRQGFGCLAVVLKESKLLIGYCGLQLYLFEGEEWSRPEVELFYKFGREHLGSGLRQRSGTAHDRRGVRAFAHHPPDHLDPP